MLLERQNLDDRMFRDINPQEGPTGALPSDSQTVEPHSSDGSASVYLLFAGATVAARIGPINPVMLDYANSGHVSGDASQTIELEQPPTSCVKAARRLLARRSTHGERDVFPAGLVDAWTQKFTNLGDEALREDIAEE